MQPYRKLTLLCSPKVTHHHCSLGGVLPPGKGVSCLTANSVRPPWAINRPAGEPYPSARMMENHPALLRRG